MNQLQAPILFLGFNRPEVSFKVFGQIAKVKPEKLFIAVDGPRKSVPGEELLCQQVRSIVDRVDWPCEVFTLFQEENKGCGKGVSAAINWFFSHVEEGIIVEDDCFADTSFFFYVQQMLSKFRDNERVMTVCGSNFLHGYTPPGLDYFFSRHHFIWGWGTWKRAWKRYDYALSAWQNPAQRPHLLSMLNHHYRYKTLANRLARCFDDVVLQRVDTWDYQWFFACIMNNALSVLPAKNLVSNLGAVGAHTKKQESFIHKADTYTLNTKKLTGPRLIAENKALDDIIIYNKRIVDSFSIRDKVLFYSRRLFSG